MKTFRRGGVVYRADAPFDELESRGTLAVDTRVGPILIPAGSIVWRDIDLDHVCVVLTSPLTVGDLELPTGTDLQFRDVRRVGPWWKLIPGYALGFLLVLPAMLVWLLFALVGRLGRDRSFDGLITATVGADCVIAGRSLTRGESLRIDTLLPRPIPRATVR